MFAVHGSIWLAFGVMVAVSACAVPFALRRPPPRIAAWSLAILGARARGRDHALVGRGVRRRRVLPPRARAQARRLRLDLAAEPGRVQGRRAPPGLRVPALARPGRARLQARRRRPDPGRAARADRADAAVVPAHLRVRRRALPLALGRAGDAARRRSRCSASLPATGASFVSLALAANASRMLVLPALLALVFMYVREPSWQLLGVRRGGRGGDDADPPAALGARPDRARRVPRRARADGQAGRRCDRGGASRRSRSRRRRWASGCSRSCATRSPTTRARRRCTARSRTTATSSTSSGCTATGSSPTCSAAEELPPWRRSRCSRSRSSRAGGSGRRSSSAGCSPRSP